MSSKTAQTIDNYVNLIYTYKDLNAYNIRPNYAFISSRLLKKLSVRDSSYTYLPFV